ncbi:Yip1 domain-containing protein [Catenaria anguillulae PL171]|uniref:Protein YIP n=1 Tax=Catenaria anguillulae PL171 TaxID=765915 RepID=A0A1Y2H646_9FUNG|nr:Yip1 domain-containing protein [Catenaria anguillulae PL171]
MAALLPAEGEIRTFVGGDTLDEPVSVTILRDLKAIGTKLKRVCLPKGQSNVLRDYDLWGPLLLCLGLSITMSLSAPPEQTAHVFSGIFVLVWVGAAVVTLNTKLLGGTLSFFQSVCVLGYCVFPLFLASILCLFIGWMLVRGPVVLGAFMWSTYASLAFLTSVNLAGRRLLALYPVYLFYFALAWMIVISKALV